MAFSAVSWSYRDPITFAKLSQMEENVRTHDHRNDGSQGAPYPRVAAGSGVESGRAGAGLLWTSVSLPAGRFTTAPRVKVDVSHTQAGMVVSSFGVRNVTTTGFEVGIERGGSNNTPFTWTAVQA